MQPKKKTKTVIITTAMLAVTLMIGTTMTVGLEKDYRKVHSL